MVLGGPLAILIAAAQSPLATQPIEQLPSAASADTDIAIDQLGQRSPETAGSARPAANDVRPPLQISTDAESRSAPGQLSRAERAAPAPNQLNRGGRTAQAPDALSSPAQGRRGDQAAVGGADRCDRASPDPAIRAVCARVIETRSADFARPDPVTLSPEQRILVEQRLRETPTTQRSLTRRMAEDAAANPDDVENQEVASLVLGRPGTSQDTGPAQRREEIDANTQAATIIIQAIINGGQNGPN